MPAVSCDSVDAGPENPELGPRLHRRARVMPLPRHVRTVFAVCFWAYGLFLMIATHAPADDVQFIVRAADYGLLDPDKLLHMAAYGVLGLLAALAYGGRWQTTLSAAIALFVLLAVWGAADEVTQPLFGRLADMNDWVCDLVGGAIGLAAGFAASRWLAASGWLTASRWLTRD